MKSDLRKQQVLKRKNFFPALTLTIFLWLSLGATIYFVDPDIVGAIFLFLILIFFAILFTFSLIIGNTKRGFILSASITLFLILRYFGVGNVLNLVLIAALALTCELYFLKK